MKNRGNKQHQKAGVERATGRVGPFPYHRANEVVKRQRKIQSQFAEDTAKQQQAQAKLAEH
jgi:hypothetical protein